MNIQETISIQFGILTAKDKKIAQEILQNPQKFAQTNVQEAALALHSSPASLVRFAQKLGYRGFPEFRSAIFNYTQETLAKDKEEKAPTLMQGVLSSYLSALSRLKEIDFEEKLQEVAKMMHEKSQVKALGIGNSALPAQQLVYSLYTQNTFMEALETETKIYFLRRVLTSEHLLIIYSASGIDGYYREVFQDARQKGATTVLVTMNEETRGNQLADYSFVLPAGEIHLSKTGQISHVDNRLIFFAFSEILASYYQAVQQELGQ